MRSVSTLARWLHQFRRSFGTSATLAQGRARRERAVRQLRAHDQAADPWLAEERVLLSAPAVVLSVTDATYTENSPPVTLDPAVMAIDPDLDFIDGAEVKITDYEMGQDQLSFTPQFGITGSFDSMTGILTLNGVGTAGEYATVLSSVQYENLSDNPTDLQRTIEYTITDTEPTTSTPVTLTLNLVSVADTPANVMATVDEDTLSAPIVLAPNPIDGASVTHFQITGITNGTLYQADGVTQINDGDFITLADATAGVRFQGNADYFGAAEFKFQAATGNTLADLGGMKATASITVDPVADTPADVIATVDEDILSVPIILTPNAVDGLSVTHFQITGITNGTLYQADGMTVISNGDFVTVAQATAGLKFQGNADYFGPAEFKFQAATGNTASELGGNQATANITVNPVADTPANVITAADEDLLSAPIILAPNPVDGLSVTHFQITGITNGTLFQADGITPINNGDFITLTQATAGVTFKGNADYYGPAQFQFQAATSNMVAGLAGALATASITVDPVADTPADVMQTVNEDTLSLPIVLVPNAVDGLSVTHFQITGITNGTLYLNDGVTVVNNGDFVTAADAAAGLKYQGNADYYGPAEFKFQAAVGPNVTDLGGNLATANITVSPIADTPANVMQTVDEDTLSAPIVLTPNPVDGLSVTHFQITGITNGTLYLNDGMTVVNNGDFVTVADAAAGLKYQGYADYFGPAEFKFQAATGNTAGDLGGAKATASITVDPIADTPANVMETVDEDILSGPIVLTPNAVDGLSVTHFQITGITNGTLYLNDGMTVVNNGDFITAADAAAGLKYQGNADYFGPAEFKFQAATGNTLADLDGGVATASITVDAVADTPADVMTTVDEDLLSAPIVLTPNAVDGLSVTHFQITGITNGTLYLNDGMTVVNNGDFVTVADAAAGLKYQGNTNYFGPAEFKFQAATGDTLADLGGVKATASITVDPIADTPADVMQTVDEDTLSAPIVLTPNAVDGLSVTHFQITGITNGTLYQADGITVINNGDFITAAQAGAGVRYQGNLNYFGPAEFKFQAAVGPTIADLGGDLATAAITVDPIADTPADVMQTVDEDMLSLPIVLTPNPVDGMSVTHFQITGITNGTLYLNDGMTVVNNGDFVTVADAAAGLKYQGNADYFGPAEFKFQAAVGPTVADLGGSKATANITVTPIADTPADVMQTVDEDTLSAPIVLTPNAVDGMSVTHFQITGITNGTLYLNDGMTVVNNGDFVTAADAAAGLKYRGNADYFGPAEFKFQAATDNTLADLNGGVATASITVDPIADTPADVLQTVNEDTLSLPIVLTPNPVDGLSVTHFQITGITNGTLYQADGMTVINNGDFITVADAAAGLKYQGNADYFGPAEFKFQAAVGSTVADLGGAKATAAITVDPIADTPPDVMQTVDEDMLSNPIVLTPNAVDGASVTHFQITGITNGTLYLNDGVTVINNGDFITAAQAAAGVRYQGNLNYFGPAEFKFQAAIGPTVADLGGSKATATIDVISVNDNPTITVPGAQTTDEGSVLPLPGIVIDDVDVENNLLTVEFQPTGPTANYTLTETTGITFLNGTNGGNVPLKIQGTLADLQAALSTLEVQPYDDGPLDLKLVITDELNGSNHATIPITVLNVAPTPTVTGDTTGIEGTAINVSASSTDPANLPSTALNNDSVMYTWSVTKDGNPYDSGSGTNFTFTPNNQGTYVVTLTAADEDGGVKSTTHTINVFNVAPTTTINATDIDGQFYTYVDMTVADPGDDNINVLIVWGDINPNDFLSDPFLNGESAANDRVFPTVSHRYLTAPNPQDPLAPVTITFFISDGTDIVVQTVVVQVTEQGIPAGGVYVTPEPEQIILPPPQVIVIPPDIVTQPAQQQVRNEEIVSREETLTDEEARLVLHVVGPTGVEGPAVTLPDGLLKNLRGLFGKLPDGHYRVYLVQGESRRLVIEVFVRQGRAIDPAEANQGTQERPPQSQPAAQEEPPRVMQAEPVGQAVPDESNASIPTNTAERHVLSELPLPSETLLNSRQAQPVLQNTADSEPETAENAAQAGVASLAAAGIVAGNSWRRIVRRQRAALITGPENGEKIEKTWSRLARRARQWKPR